MRRVFSIVVLMFLWVLPGGAFNHMEYDYVGALSVEGGYDALKELEDWGVKSLNEIMNHYVSAETASAGIYGYKFLEQRSLKDLGIFHRDEARYYANICAIVEKRIFPRVYYIGKHLLEHPDKFLYWGPYLYDVCENVRSLCMQFQVIVTNNTMSFSNIKFLCLNSDLKKYYDLSKLGDVRWDDLWNNLIDFKPPTWEDFREDFKTLFSKIPPVNIAIAGAESITGRASGIFDHIGDASSIPQFIQRFEQAYREVSSGAAMRDILVGTLGDLKDSLAVNRLFNLADYRVDDYLSDYWRRLHDEFYTQTWYIYHYDDDGVQVIDYKETLDTHTSSETVFQKHFDEMIERYNEEDSELNSTEPTYYRPTNRFGMVIRPPKTEYFIGKDDKHYYQLATSETVRNCSRATFSVTCEDRLVMAEGEFSFHVGGNYSKGRLMEYAYPTQFVKYEREYPDITPLTDMQDQAASKIADNLAAINDLKSRIAGLEAQRDTIGNASERRKIGEEISRLRFQLSDLEANDQTFQGEYNEASNLISELNEDFYNELDGDYRIPHLERDLAQDFHIVWDGPGSKGGNTYTRVGYVKGMEGKVILTCKVSEKRSPKKFLFIRIRDAIVGVDWELVSAYGSTDIVDVLELTGTDEENADAINAKRDEVQANYPKCRVNVTLDEDKPLDQDTEESFHLLWPSDRLALARFILSRLREIDSELAIIEKNMYMQRSVLKDFVKGFTRGVRKWRGDGKTDSAFIRWMDASDKAMYKTKENS